MINMWTNIKLIGNRTTWYGIHFVCTLGESNPSPAFFLKKKLLLFFGLLANWLDFLLSSSSLICKYVRHEGILDSCV